MGDGVSPVGDRKLLDDEKETEDVYEDAMETTVDESKQAATTAVEEKTTSANAEVPGSKAEEANTKDGWQEVRARERRVPTPPSPPLEQEPMKYVEVHLQMEGPLANRAAVVRKLGGPANVRWCAVRGSVECPSSRSFGMRLLMTEPVRIALRAQKENLWVIDAMTMTVDGVVLTTRYRRTRVGRRRPVGAERAHRRRRRRVGMEQPSRRCSRRRPPGGRLRRRPGSGSSHSRSRRRSSRSNCRS